MRADKEKSKLEIIEALHCVLVGIAINTPSYKGLITDIRKGQSQDGLDIYISNGDVIRDINLFQLNRLLTQSTTRHMRE